MRDFNNSIFPQKIVQGCFNIFLHFYNQFFTFFENRPFDFTMFYHWDLIKIFKNRPSSVFSFICTYIPKITIFENRPRSVFPILCMQPSKIIKFYKKFLLKFWMFSILAGRRSSCAFPSKNIFYMFYHWT